MRKRTAFIKLGLTTAVALSLRCGGPRQEAQRCVDQVGRVVEDRYCEQRGAPIGYYPYRWYYGGSGFFPGQVASGGRDTPTPGLPAVRASSPGFASSGAAGTSSSVTRGGFGGTGEGSGGGE